MPNNHTNIIVFDVADVSLTADKLIDVNAADDKTIDVDVAEHKRNNCDIVHFFNVGQHTASGDINVCEVERDSRCRDSFHWCW